MVRPIRIDLPHCLYHVLSRSNTGDVVFQNASDRNKFFSYLAQYVDLFSFKIHAWCLMPTHFHLILESTIRPSLSELMRRLLTAYTLYYNRKYGRHGHLFQGRFKSFVVDRKAYLLALSRYIHLNPAQSGNCKDPETCDGSSLQYYASGGEPHFLYSAEILSFFKGNRRHYVRFVKEGLKKEIKLGIINQRYLGDEAFASRMRKRLGQEKKTESRAYGASRKREVLTREAEENKAKDLLKKVAGYFGITEEQIRRGRRCRREIGKARAITLALLHENIAWTYRELAAFLGLKNKSILDYHLRKLRSNKELMKILREIQNSKE